MSDPWKPLSGLRILIVEDEYLAAEELRRHVERFGGVVAAMTGRLEEARDALPGPLDGVLLDVQLASEKTYGLAEELLAVGIPFIFITGFDSEMLPEHLRSCPRLTKPFPPGRFERLATATFVRD